MVATRLYQPWRSILSVLNRSLKRKDLSSDTLRLLILQILWGIVHSANLDIASLIYDEFEWQSVERSSRPSNMSKLLYTRFTKLIINHFLSNNTSIPRRSSSKLHSSQDDQPITKLSNAVKGDYKFGMEIPDIMIKEQHVSPVKSGRGKGFMCYVDQVVNVPNKPKKDVVLRKTRSLTIAEETIVVGQKLKGPAVDDPAVQSLLDLQKGSKARKLESLNLDKIEESENEIDDANESDMDLSDDNPDRDDDATGANSEGNPELTSYISGASKVPLGTHGDVLETKTLLQEIFSDENAHHKPSLALKKISYNATTPQPSSLQAKAKKQMQKAKQNMREINFKKAVIQKFREYDQKLEALTNFNVSEAFEKTVQAKVLTEMKKLLPTHIPKAGVYRKKRQKDVDEPSSRSSRRNKSPMVHAQVDTLAIQPQDQEDEYVLDHPNSKWFPKKSGPSIVAIAKKIKAIIQKDELTIADLEGAGLERLKQ
ncbi:hypothetical protein Tco_1339471 [Tanacetum coccineum]